MPPAPTVLLPAPCLAAMRKLRDVSRDDQARTGGSGAYPSGVRSRLAPRSGSPRAPRQGRSPGGSPLGRSVTRVPVPAPDGAESRSLGSVWWQDPRPKPRFRLWQSMDRDPGSCRVRSSRAEAQSCPTIWPGQSAGGSAPTFVPLLPDRFGLASSPVCRFFQTGVRRTVGRFSKPAAFASAKGQARSFRLAAASSAALPSLSARCLVRQGPAAPAVAGKATIPLPEDRLGHGLKLPFNPSRSKGNLPVDNEDNGHNLRPRNVSGTAANREA